MNIQRYDLEPGSESMQRFPDGDYVLHADHLEAVKQARADALRWALEHIGKTAPRHIDSRVYSIVDDERARLRTIIEKELSK